MNTKRTRRTFPTHFKGRVLAALQTGATVTDLAKKHEISPQLIRTWTKTIKTAPTTDKDPDLLQNYNKAVMKLGELVLQGKI